MEIITGTHYWFRQHHEQIWRIGYVGEDPDHQQWLHILGVSQPLFVPDMILSLFDWIEIPKPTENVRNTS